MRLRIQTLVNEVKEGGFKWTLLVATIGDDVVGSCQLTSNDDVVLTDLHIQLLHRRKGYGHRLVKHAISYCKRNGKKTLSLSVHKENAAAISLYNKVGMQRFCGGGDTNIWMGINLERAN